MLSVLGFVEDIRGSVDEVRDPASQTFCSVLRQPSCLLYKGFTSTPKLVRTGGSNLRGTLPRRGSCRSGDPFAGGNQRGGTRGRNNYAGWGQPERIREVDRIPVREPIQVQPTSQPNRIFLGERSGSTVGRTECLGSCWCSSL